MEERIIDDEIGRKVRLRKTEDGYVEVTDDLVAGEDDGEEIAFELPVFDQEETDEDLIGIDPAEAARIKKERAEEDARRKAECETYCVEAEKLLATESFKAACLEFDKALALIKNREDEGWETLAARCLVGSARAKTSNFAEPDEFVEQYVEEGVESMEYDFGYLALKELQDNYKDVFSSRYNELAEEEKPLAESVEGKQKKRRAYLKSRLIQRLIAFGVVAVPMIVAIVLTIVFGMKNFTIRGNDYILPTVISGGAAFVLFLVFAVFTSKLLHALRMYRSNEDLEATEDGERLVQIRGYKEIYEYLLNNITAEETEEVAENSQPETETFSEED